MSAWQNKRTPRQSQRRLRIKRLQHANFSKSQQNMAAGSSKIRLLLYLKDVVQLLLSYCLNTHLGIHWKLTLYIFKLTP